MPARRPVVQVSGALNEVALTDQLNVGLEGNLSRTVNATNGLTAITLTTRYTFVTGTSGVTFVITLPAAAAAIDGMKMTITSTVGRSLTSWSSSGGVVTGLPTSLTANNAVAVMYVHASTRWFVID